MSHARLSTWIDAYENAWRTPGTDWLEYLFTADATYSMGPFEKTVEGLEAIAELWEREREGHDEVFRMEQRSSLSRGHGRRARGGLVRRPGQAPYRDLWIVRLDDHGLCTRVRGVAVLARAEAISAWARLTSRAMPVQSEHVQRDLHDRARSARP